LVLRSRAKRKDFNGIRRLQHILWSIINKHADYTPFISPVFSQIELKSFHNKFDEEEYDFDKDSLLEIMEQNINW